MWRGAFGAVSVWVGGGAAGAYFVEPARVAEEVWLDSSDTAVGGGSLVKGEMMMEEFVPMLEEQVVKFKMFFGGETGGGIMVLSIRHR